MPFLLAERWKSLTNQQEKTGQCHSLLFKHKKIRHAKFHVLSSTLYCLSFVISYLSWIILFSNRTETNRKWNLDIVSSIVKVRNSGLLHSVHQENSLYQAMSAKRKWSLSELTSEETMTQAFWSYPTPGSNHIKVCSSSNL